MNKRRIAAALVSSLMLTAAFAGCGITSGSSQNSEFDPTELVNDIYSAMHSRDYETEFSLRVPPDMQDEFLKEHFRNSELKDSSDLYTAFIDERNRYTTLLDGENEDFTYEILACEELGKLDKVKEILSQNNDKDSDTDIRSSDFDSAKIDDGEPAYLALVKFCLFSMGVVAGTQIPDKHKKKAIRAAACVFISTYVPLMIKVFRIAFKNNA